jgi:DNA-binding PadR family transcriptional regulator
MHTSGYYAVATEAHSTNDASPLTPIMFHILLALADGEKHGYGILKAVELDSDGQITLLTGTLYRTIKRLLEMGLLAESDERPDPELDDERRRYYRITAPGQKALSAEAERMSRALAILQSKHAAGSI